MCVHYGPHALEMVSIETQAGKSRAVNPLHDLTKVVLNDIRHDACGICG